MRPGLVISALLVPTLILGQARGGKGQGAIVTRDEAPVYESSKGDKMEGKLNRGDAVAGFTANGILAPKYLLDEVHGRVHILYFRGEQKGMSRTAWMDPKDLSRFTYDGSCETNASPLAVKGFSQRWNACFEEARDTKLGALWAIWSQQVSPPATPSPAPAARPEPTLTSTPKSQ